MPSYHLECFLFQWEVPGTHDPQATTPLCWCHGVFTDRFIFRLNFARKRLPQEPDDQLQETNLTSYGHRIGETAVVVVVFFFGKGSLKLARSVKMP